MGLGYILLIAFGAYAALQFYRGQTSIKIDVENQGVASPGVSYYDPVAATQRPQQLAAYQEENPGYGIDGASATQPGYAAAFGPMENMPSNEQEWYS